MFLSLIVFANVTEDLDRVKNYLDIVSNQSEKDFELIIVSDLKENTPEINEVLKDYFWKNDNVKLIENSSYQGGSVSFNSGIDVAEGKFLTFQFLDSYLTENFVEEIKKCYDNNPNIDLIEFKAALKTDKISSTKCFLEQNKVYDLSENKDPYAFTSDLIFTKVFNKKIIDKYNFKFRRFVRYDMLFIYKFLGRTKKYIFLDCDPIVFFEIKEKNFSIFDLVNQWPHIFNYFRRIDKYNEIKDELNYSYYKVLVHIWLWWVASYKNKPLAKKAVLFVDRKFAGKRLDFEKNNKIFLQKRDPRFTYIVENFSKWLKEFNKNGK